MDRCKKVSRVPRKACPLKSQALDGDKHFLNVFSVWQAIWWTMSAVQSVSEVCSWETPVWSLPLLQDSERGGSSFGTLQKPRGSQAEELESAHRVTHPAHSPTKFGSKRCMSCCLQKSNKGMKPGHKQGNLQEKNFPSI